MTGQEHRSHRRGARFAHWLAGFARQTHGNVAMMFGLALPLLVMVGFGAIDIHHASRVKANLQDALDAATLAAARSSTTDATFIQTMGMDALKANMPGYFGETSGDTATFLLTDNVLTADARVNVKVMIANIVLPPYGKLLDDDLPVSSSSEVLRASRNVEVGLALDVTLSMDGQPLKDLRVAAEELVKIVVQVQQTPFYSKMGIAPYASGVNLGHRAVAARGPIRGPSNIISAKWTEDAGKSISAISKANPGVITSNNHGYSVGQTVVVTDARGMTQVNNKVFVVTEASQHTFKVRQEGQSRNLDTRNFSNYTTSGGSGKVRRCLADDCSLVVKSNNHRVSDGEQILIDEMRGLTSLNRNYYQVSGATTDSFNIKGLGYALSAHTASTGRVWCVEEDCERFRFNNRQGSQTVNLISTCVTERTGLQAYTDAAPSSTSYFGRSYPSGTAACPTSQVTPLTSSRSDLTKAIKDLKVEGTTGGQIGVAWGWNLVSPRFSSFWGGTSAPGAHEPDKTLKVVVLMTDGEFNSPYCKGVLASDAAVGSLIGNSHLIANCNSPNGSPFTQAVRLCDAMKADGIIVYTVGFNLSSNEGKAGVDTAIEVMRACATSVGTHFHDTRTGTDLKEAFRSIGRDITRLRLAR